MAERPYASIRVAEPTDWPAIWPFVRRIVEAGETFCWDRDMSEEEARALWFGEPPARTFVATAGSDTVVGVASVYPNHGGPGDHVASANFMVDPDHFGHGVGRALGNRVLDQARADGYPAMQFDAVVQTNIRAVGLYRSLGFEVLTTVPEAFRHRTHGRVGLHIMYRPL